MKNRFIELLRQSGRDGAEKIVENLEKLGFFNAPASTKHHLAFPGGLVQHSVSVCETALRLREMIIAMNPASEQRLPVSSVIIASLLHDVCKAEIYKPKYRNVKNEVTGVWEKVPGFEPDYSYFPLGHGEKSVIRLLLWGVQLTRDEMLAIRWHMSAWDLPFQSWEESGNISEASAVPLVSLIQAADGLSSHILEETGE